MTPAIRVAGQVLASRVKNGVRWIARIGFDRGRLEVRRRRHDANHPTTIEPLNERELRELERAPRSRSRSDIATGRRVARVGGLVSLPAFSKRGRARRN